MTPHQTEPNANNALGKMLRGMLGKSVVRAQNSGVIVGQFHPPGNADRRRAALLNLRPALQFALIFPVPPPGIPPPPHATRRQQDANAK